MYFETMKGVKRIAILIPSKGRGNAVRKLFTRQSFLNDRDTFMGIENAESGAYSDFLSKEGNEINAVYYDNPEASIGLARERVRAAAVAKRARKYDIYVHTDDNAFYTLASLSSLVRCCAEFPDQPAVAMGYNSIHEFFNRGKKLTDDRTINGIRSYEHVSNVHIAVPKEIMNHYRYPDDCYLNEDRHIIFWCLAKGYTTMRICIDAFYQKKRYEAGGSGSLLRRQMKCGRGMVRMALDFPLFMGMEAQTKPRWKLLLRMARGYNFAGEKVPFALMGEDKIAASMVPVKGGLPKQGSFTRRR